MHVHELVVGVIALLLIAVSIRVVSKRFNLPFTVLLVLSGIVLAQLAAFAPHPFDQFAHVEISEDVILLIFLPTLIFESAFNLDARKLRQNLIPILFLAVPGVLLSTAIIGGLLYWLTPLSGVYALILGALLSATDPVAVIAIFKQLGVPKRLTVLVEGESLFNDATAIVLTHILIAVAVSGNFGVGELASGVVDFLVVFIGGLLVGVVTAFVFGWLIGHVQSDKYIEVPLTMILAYASFVMAEEIHLSGVMAVVAAGVMMGGWGRTKISPAISHYLSELWEYFAFMANALIFLLVGLLVNLQELWKSLDTLIWVIIAMLISRFVVVYMLVPLSNRFGNAERVERNYQHIMYWGGLRGAVALALVLSLPESEFKALLLALTAGAVLFTLIVQGLSIKVLVHRLGLDNPPLGDRLASCGAALDAVQKAGEAIPSLQKSSLFNTKIATELEREYQAKRSYWEKEREKLVQAELSEKEEETLLFLEAFLIEKKSYYAMFTQGDLSEQDYHDLMHSIDAQIDHLHACGRLPKSTLHGILLRRMERGFLHLLERHFSSSSLLQRYSRYYTARDYIKSWAQRYGSAEVLAKLPERAGREGISDKSLQYVIAIYSKWNKSASGRLEQTASQFPEFVDMLQERRARRLSLFAERQTVEGHIKNGEISEKMGDDLLASIDNELRQLRGYDTKGLSVDTNELLAKVAFFKTMQAEELAQIKDYLHLITVPPGEYIIHQGEQGSSMFFIARGEIKVLRETEGRSELLGVLRGGDFFGEHSLLNHETRNATCRAATACALYELRSKDFGEIIERFPEVRSAVDEVNQLREKRLNEL